MTDIHKKIFVLDSHCDTPTALLDGEELFNCDTIGHVNFDKLRRGGVDGVFFAIYAPADMDEEIATAHAMNLISKTYDLLDKNKDKAVLARTPDEALQNKEKGLISVFLGMENGSPLGRDYFLLDLFHKFGISYLTLCHSRHNLICDSCSPLESKWGGLSPFGKELVDILNVKGIMIDCSHVSDKTFYDVLECSSSPIVATHSCCRALCNHPRNMTDSMIRSLASAGGVVQINFYPVFLQEGFGDDEFRCLVADSEKWQNLYRSDKYNMVYRQNYLNAIERLKNYPSVSYKRIVDHIDHVVSLVGVKHVGIGSDFDGIEITPEDMGDISMMPLITDELISRGYSEDDIRGIMGGNFLNVMKEVQSRALF